MSLSDSRLRQLDLHFRAANYLSAAQLYLADNVLLRQPLQPEHIKRRLLGHWGTTPGLNFIYTHLNRLIADTGAPLLQVVGVGHGAPAVLSCLYLEGSLGEVYPQCSHGAEGLHHFVRSFSWPGGFPSHLTAQVPGTIHEGGELGYGLLHAHGAAFDNPELVVPCVIGDGEAETGPLAASWMSPRFVDPRQDGAVLPVLHLNGDKLSGPSLLARMPQDELVALLAAHGYQVRVVGGDEPAALHRRMWETLDWAYQAIRAGQREARAGSGTARQPLHWPLIVLRTPKGWTGPKSLDGKPVEGTFRAHQIPIADPRGNADHLRALEQWLRSYAPEELFDADGRPFAEVTACCPRGGQRLGRSPDADGGARLQALRLPEPGAHGPRVERPGAGHAGNAEVLGGYLRAVFEANEEARNFRLFCPDETNSNKLGAVFQATARRYEGPLMATDEDMARDGRVMEVLSEHLCEGWLEGYLQTGRHGVFACYEAFVSIIDSMMYQYAKWQKMAHEVAWRKPVASLNVLLTSHVWEQDHNGYSHQGPTFINALLTKKSGQVRVFLPPDANSLLAVAQHCLSSRDLINLIVTSKKSMPQWLDPAQARAHLEARAGAWDWAGTPGEPEVVLACAGDVPTREAAAAALLLRRHVPELRLRLVNIVDLLSLQARERYEHGLDEERFAALFTADAPVIMAFHGYPTLIHELIYRRPAPGRFHVHGYQEEGTTTTPFDMLVRNQASRFHLASDALRRAGREDAGTRKAIALFEEQLAQHCRWIVEHGDDLPQVARWDTPLT